MLAIYIRIALRYGAGILVAKGLLAPEVGVDLSNDPDVTMALQVAAGVIAGAVSEAWYFLARRLGWAK
ncbi:hypothetical protein [Ensifer aridi]|uniref:Pam3-gp28 family putative phage holin n=1 Tax=Ensifer aridi TaxID=1708715 RepID=UPI000A11F557|nr:hypothetical protein [Ensifer aridi]